MPTEHFFTVKMLLVVLCIFLWNKEDGGLAANVPAKVMLPSSTVRALKGYKMSCLSTGTPPIQTKAMWNSSLIGNASDVLTIYLNKEGKYKCEAKNQFGKDEKEFSVKFADCGRQCSQGEGEWYSDSYTQWGNTFSCSGAKSQTLLRNCAPTLVDVLYLTRSNLNDLPVDMFWELKNVKHLFLVSSNIKKLHKDLFSHLKKLQQLDLSSNDISEIPVTLFSSVPQLNSLNLSSNNIHDIQGDVFSALSNLTYLSLSRNKLEKPHPNLFMNLTNVEFLDLSHNHIVNLSDTLFCCVEKLEYLFLQHNQISAITNYTFSSARNLKYLLLSNNDIGRIPSFAFVQNRQKLEILVLNDNKVWQIEKDAIGFGDDLPPEGLIIYMIRTDLPQIDLDVFNGIKDTDSHELIMNDELIGYLRYYAGNRELCKIYLNPNASTTKEITVSAKIYERARLSMVTYFLEIGFQKAFQSGSNDENFTDHYILSPCPEGTFSPEGRGCQECPPGGYFSDSAALVAKECQECPLGAFVKLDIYPGTRYKNCRACPRGTNTNQQAGLIACTCLEGFHRTNIFGKCEECERGGVHEGLDCAKTDFLDLKPGYWWEWQNETHKERYRNFTHNLLRPNASYDNTFRDFTYEMPKATKCPREASCQGGVASLENPCKPGYEGPVCGICQFGYYKQLQSCTKCPTKKWMAIQFGIFFGFVLIIIAIIIWYSRKKTKKAEGRALIDVIFARLKIVIGFYQVTYGLLEAFSFVKWPDVLEDISRYSELLQLNIFQIAPLHCLISSLHVDAFGSLFATMGLNAFAILFFAFIFGVRYVMISASGSLTEEAKAKRISHTKELIYKNLFFFLFVTYLSTCSKTANVLPLACRRLCRDKGETLCDDYLKADYGIRCNGSRYHLLLIGAYFNILYIIALPAFSITVLWRERRMILASKEDPTLPTSEDFSLKNLKLSANQELVTGLSFIYENYTTKAWYWELIEMARKIALTSGLILIGQENRAYVGVTCLLAGLYGMLFAFRVPIQDAFENKMMVTSLAVTFINLGIGTVSRIPSENQEPSKDPLMDTTIFKITVLGTNTLVIGQLVVEYISYLLRFLMNWIKNPHWSFACCQNLLLPVNDLREDENAELVEDEEQMANGDEQMEMFSLSIERLENHPAAKENAAYAIHPASKEDEAFAIRPAENEDKMLAMHPAARENEAFVVHPSDLDSEADVFRVSYLAGKANKRFTSQLKDKTTCAVHLTTKDHLAIDVIPEEHEGEQNHAENVLEEGEELGQGAKLNGQVEEEEEEEEVPPVEMCDQEVQTDLSTLEMDEAELFELFGEPLDESLLSQPSTEDQDAISPDGNDEIREDSESTSEPDVDQGDSHSQGQEASPEPEMDQYDSVSQGSEMDQNDSNSHQGTESTPEPEIDQCDSVSQGSEMDHNDSNSHQGTEYTPEPEIDSISQDTESTQGSEMEQNDSNSHLGKEPVLKQEDNQDNETFTSAF